MLTKQKIAFKTLLISAAIMIPLVGCASEKSGSTPDSATPAATPVASAAATAAATTADATKYPLVIKHAFGETTIPSKPKRVATIQWANHDVVLALGVVPVGFSAANYGVQDKSGLLPWTAKKLKELNVDKPNVFQDTDGLNFEAISASKPDVILAAYSGITQKDYETLSKIAPVVAYAKSPWVTTWREQVLFNATGMGMKAEGEKLIKDTEDLIKKKASEYPQLKGKKVAFTNFSAKDLSKINIYTAADPRGAFLIELGMVYSDGVTKKITDPTAYNLKLSSENADALNDADILIGYGDDALLQAVKADPILGKIPAVQKGAVVMIGNGTPLAASGNPNPLSISYTIDEYLKLIAAAVK
ncbi:iron-siderophore ABC transporter substrate-binding protein [Paenibacillus qinlingensis]|uniref:Iron complex transport system substrate-binding protein n=1 Tax=Paenibacillus qinlingensis TaxID=1837343 RepID=A0ABU1P324_9BACL|nr:iron-siderophore ABC transporter substrate-binding protein [Paenibacillus qinlingensis]MDR6554154.1 iron complex transport system substrate-binding protein [Paenibacillus qinlingensis]